MSPNNIHTYIYTYSAPIVKIDEDIARISQIKPKLGNGPKLNRVFVWTMSKTELWDFLLPSAYFQAKIIHAKVYAFAAFYNSQILNINWPPWPPLPPPCSQWRGATSPTWSSCKLSLYHCSSLCLLLSLVLVFSCLPGSYPFTPTAHQPVWLPPVPRVCLQMTNQGRP